MKYLCQRFLVGVSICASLSFFNVSAVAATSNPNPQTFPTIAPMLDKITPTIVNISVEKEMSPSQSQQGQGQNPPGAPPAPAENSPSPNPIYLAAVGSGVIFDAAHGLIITNAHVVQDQHLMLVTLKDGRRFRASLVGKDTGFDIAIIKIPPVRLQQLSIGDSDQIKVGDFVAAIGSPFGLTQTVTTGIISALNRATPQIEGFQSFIQTDAPINPGNSGGALVNMKGQLIGINTAMFTPTYGNIGIGFAIPSNMVQSVINQLLKYGKVQRGMLGVVVQEITPELADILGIKQYGGVLVSEVMPGTPAQDAGLKTEDIIQKLNGKAMTTANQLRNTLGLMPPGTAITLTVSRQHKILVISAHVGNPSELKQHQAPFLAGMRLQNFSELQMDGTMLNGVIVNEVDDTSAGAIAGLEAGDVITAANEQPIPTVRDLMEAANKATDHLLLKTTRANMTYYLVLQPS